MEFVLLGLPILAIVGVLYLIFGKKGKFVVKDPAVGFLNLASDEGAALLAEDKAAVSRHFSRILESDQ